MEYQKKGKLIAVRVNRGEEIVACVREVCKKERVRFASAEGIGAVDRAVVGLYHVGEKKYCSNTFTGEMEMTSLLGNVTEKDDDVYLHFHAAFAKEDGQVVGGHLNEAVVSGTAEIILRTGKGSVGRRADPETGLNLFDFRKEKKHG